MFSIFQTEENKCFLVNENTIKLMTESKRLEDGLFYTVIFDYHDKEMCLQHLGSFDNINDALMAMEWQD